MDRIKGLKPWGFLLGEEDSKDDVYNDMYATLHHELPPSTEIDKEAE